VVSPFQEALSGGDFTEAMRLRNLRTPYEPGQFGSLLTPETWTTSTTGDVFQPYLIYPKASRSDLDKVGQIVKHNEGNYAFTGNWKLDDDARILLEQRLGRALQETGMSVLPMQVLESSEGLATWRNDWGPPAERMGVGNLNQQPENVKPVYLVRGLGGFAGAHPGADFKTSYMTMGDSVIESLAGYEGPTAYEKIQVAEGRDPEEARYMASYQSQMGTVLHESLHQVGAMPHTKDEAMVDWYATDYGGAHGDKFMQAIDDSIRGTRPEDSMKAMRLVMQESWNYGWGAPGTEPAPLGPDQSGEEGPYQASITTPPQERPGGGVVDPASLTSGRIIGDPTPPTGLARLSLRANAPVSPQPPATPQTQVKPTGASSMPQFEEGRLRRNPQTQVWEAWDKSDGAWLNLSQYYPPSARAGASVDAQRDALGKMQSALYTMPVYQVTGTHIGNYEFHLRNEDWVDWVSAERQYEDEGFDQPGAARSLGFDALIREHAINVQGGAISSFEYSGHPQDYYHLIPGFNDNSFYRWENVKGFDDKGKPINLFIDNDPTKGLRRERVLDPANAKMLMDAIKTHLGLLADITISIPTPDGKGVLTHFKGKTTETKAPEPTGTPSMEVIRDPRPPFEPIYLLKTDADGKTHKFALDSTKAKQWTQKTLNEGGTVAPDVAATETPAVGQPGGPRAQVAPDTTGGLPVTPFGQRRGDLPGGLVENIVPGYNMVETGPERWELVPQAGFTPRTRAGQVIEEIVPGYDAIATADGRLQLVEKVPGKGEELPLFKPYAMGDGRFIIRTGPDDFETVTSAGESWFLDDWGNAYMRDVSGNLQPVEPPTMEEQINRALVEGNGTKAMALADFRDRPSAEERFRLAMEFARSPGDLMTISAIVRGLIEPPAPIEGQVTRVAARPDWVVSAWKDLTKSWGIPEGLGTVIPGAKEGAGVTPAAVQDALQKGDFPFIWEAQDQSDAANKENISNVLTGGVDVSAFDPKITTDPLGRGGVTFGTTWKERLEADPSLSTTGAFSPANALDPSPGGRRFQQPPGVQFEGQRFATQFAADLAAQDAAPVTSAAAQDMAALGFAGQEGNISTGINMILQDLLARYGERGFSIEQWNEYMDELAAGPGDIVSRVNAAEQYFIDEYEQEGEQTFDDSLDRYARQVAAVDTQYEQAAAQEAARVAALPSDATREDIFSLAQTTVDPEIARGEALGDISPEVRAQHTLDLVRARRERQAAQVPVAPAPVWEDTDVTDFEEYYTAAPDVVTTPAQTYQQAFTEAREAMGGVGATTKQVWDVDPDFYDIGFAGGGKTFRDTMALVGEEGPELVNLPEGAEVIPADFTQAMLQGRRPRRMQYGGMVQIGGTGEMIRESDLETLRRGAVLDQDVSSFDFQPDQRGPVQFTERRLQPAEPKVSPYPAGVQQVLAGRPIEQPRSLFRPAGLRVPSAQAMRNLVPEEMEAYRELGTLAGIPKGAYEREFRQAMPGGQARVRRPRFQARRQRRL